MTDQQQKSAIKFSIVIPILNESESISALHQELVQNLDQLGDPYELIFVDDGSTDDTKDVLKKLSEEDERVVALHFLRNFGKSAAYSAGFEVVKGEIVVTIDGDLQDDPNELAGMIELLGQGNDLVIGAKKNRFETEPLRKLSSLVFNTLLAVLFKIKLQDSNSGFRVMGRQVAQALSLYGDRYRFIPQLAHVKGFKVAELKVTHRKRQFGESKYGLTRLWTGIFDIISIRVVTGFEQKPLQFFSLIGMPTVILGVLLELYVLISKLMGDTFREHMAALVVGIFFLLIGVQILSLGLLGEMLATRGPRSRYWLDNE